MKRQFTFLLAAFAMIMCLAMPMGMRGQTMYEQLTSIANIDENAQYVLGIDGTGFHYSGTSNWGLTALPSAQTPIYYTLTKASDGNSFTAKATIGNTTYYLQVPTSNTFSMATSAGTNTDLIIGTTQISGTNYAVANKTTTARHLRINGTSGLRSYAGTTGTMAFFYKVVTGTSYTVTYYANVDGTDPIEATYFEGATVTVAPNTFVNPGHAFTEWNTEENGTGDSYSPDDEIKNINADIDLYAQWEVSYETVDELTYAFTGISGTSYAEWSNKTGASGAIYAGRSGGNYSTIQLNNSSPNGIVSTTSGGKVTKVVMTWNSNTSNGRSVDIYGSNTAYTESADLYDTNKQGTKLGSIVKGTSTTLTISGNYTYIGIRNPGSAVYLDKVEITWSAVPSTDPSITADDVEIAYDATSGSIMGEIVNYVEGTISATTDADWISNFTYDQADEIFEVDFDATVNPSAVARTANVTLTFTYGNDETTTKDVTVSQTGNPNGPGTQNNPYTVAQAIDAIDNNGNVTNVYATGVVSQVTYFSQNNHYITYYISADGSTTGAQLEAYRGKGIDGADFSSIDDIQVGDVVVIKGNLMYYPQSSTYEFAENNQLVSLTHPTYPIINANDITINYNATSGEIEYSITNPVDGQNLTATTSADWISNIIVGTESVTFTTTANEGDADRSATITLSYEGATDKVITVTQAHYVPDYATLPFAYDEDGTGTLPAGFTCEGLSTYSSSPKMQFNSTGDWAILKINERPGILTFDIKGNTFSGGTFKVQTSEDGVTYTDLKTYTTLGNTQSEEFTNLGENVRYIKWIYTNKSSGNVALGNIALAKYVAPNPYNLTVSLNDNVNAIYVFNAADQTNPLIADGGAGTVSVLERTSIMISPVVAEGCALTSLMVNSVNVINQLDETGAYTFTMPSQNVAISATAMATTTYTLATTIESGRHYIITNGDNMAMGAQGNNNRPAVEISKNGNTATVTSADVREVVINGPDANGYYTIYDAVVPGFLYAASSSSNYLRTETHLDTNALWTITFDEVLDNAIITAQGSNSHKLMRYNKNGSGLFSCYEIENSQEDVYLYVKDETTPQYDFYMDIAGYGSNNNVATGWNLIASPVSTTPDQVTNMLTDETVEPYSFDLYRFNQAADQEWENYHQHQIDFNIVPGQGYLYANSNTVTLKFSGELYEGDGTFTMENAGWYLLGNPFNSNVTVDVQEFMVMNKDGSQIITSENSTIAPMQGIFVYLNEDGMTVTFSPQQEDNANSNSNPSVVMNLTQNRGSVIDRAIVRFGEGRQMPKFQLFENSTKVYIPQDNEDYAIVRSEAQGELPVSFRASENGTYTLSMNVENVDMNYLHLIDNMTGMDIDLLQTPSYTFEANTNDYANRFKLVFAANGANEADEASFAFFSNGNLIVNNEGNATLQVIDINGRILSSETISGSCSKAINATTGVYMLRLINGENVKVQKVVVR